MGNSNTPNLKKQSDYKILDNISYYTSSVIGFRSDQEDRENGFLNIYNDQKNTISFFAVYDGHGGSGTSFELSKSLFEYLYDNEKDKTFTEKFNNDKTLENLYLSYDKIKFIGNILLNIDNNIISGSTCCSIIIKETEDEFEFISLNVGDSRLFIVLNDEICFHTNDHKPDNDEEKKRIIKAGGFVANHRVDGCK
jgi:serine/threonine protein phosphatase PrpC